MKKYGVDIPLFTVLFKNNTIEEYIKYKIIFLSQTTFPSAIFLSKSDAYIKKMVKTKNPKRPVFNIISKTPFSI